MQYFAECFLHVFSLFDFFIGPFVMEAKYGYTVLIDTRGVDFAVVVIPGQRGAPSSHTHIGTVEAPIVVFEGCAIAALLTLCAIFGGYQVINAGDPIQKSIGGHMQPAAVFDMVSPWEAELFVIPPPWRIDMHTANTVFIVAFPIEQLGEESAGTRAGRIVQIAPH